jgi:S-adenosyl methyltransferase
VSQIGACVQGEAVVAGDWPQNWLKASQPVPAGLDTGVPHIARVYDYWLGGKDNFAADREAAEQVVAAYPGILRDVRAQRAFLANAVRYLAGVAGIRQFVDIGTGIPTASNTHEVAQGVAPGCRVVYVDNDPMVLAHARVLLVGTTAPTAYVDADLRDTGKVVAEAARLLDFTAPIAVMLISVLHLIPDEDDPHAIVTRLMEAVPSGSWLVLSHPARDVHPQQVSEAASRFNQLAPAKATLRTGRRSCSSSAAWTCWTPAWFRSTGGSPARPPPGTARRQPATAALPASLDRSHNWPQRHRTHPQTGPGFSW